MGEGCLVYGKMATCVPAEKKPLGSMRFLLPGLEFAKKISVLLLQVSSIYIVKRGNAFGVMVIGID